MGEVSKHASGNVKQTVKVKSAYLLYRYCSEYNLHVRKVKGVLRKDPGHDLSVDDMVGRSKEGSVNLRVFASHMREGIFKPNTIGWRSRR